MRSRVALPAAAWAIAAAAGPAGAHAADAAPGTGGAPATTAIRVDAIECRSACTADGAVMGGGLVRLRGRGLERAARVLFAGDRSAPAVRARPERPGARAPAGATSPRVRPAQADVRVPAGAASGPVRVADANGALSAASAVALVVAPGSARPVTRPAPLPAAKRGLHVDARVAARRVVFGATEQAALGYAVRGGEPLDVAVDLVRLPDGAPVAHWPAATVAPGGEQVLTWDGLAGGRVPRSGAYEFRVFVASAGATASSAQAGGPDATAPFAFVPDVFPIQGPFRVVDGAGRFGATRAGHVHEGQDVASACGTPLVAVRGGTVKFSAFQARAGNYVVIDGDKTGWDFVYMHLRDPALAARGAHVVTGQPIGYVGDTGDAEGCHLHFELWSAPGWYTGGHPVDPLPSLLRWAGQG